MKYKSLAHDTIYDAHRLALAGEDPDTFLVWAEEVGFHNYESDRDEGIAIHCGTDTDGEPIYNRANPGDWILKDPAGRFFVLEPRKFDRLLMKVPDMQDVLPLDDPNSLFSQCKGDVLAYADELVRMIKRHRLTRQKAEAQLDDFCWKHRSMYQEWRRHLICKGVERIRAKC